MPGIENFIQYARGSTKTLFSLQEKEIRENFGKDMAKLYWNFPDARELFHYKPGTEPVRKHVTLWELSVVMLDRYNKGLSELKMLMDNEHLFALEDLGRIMILTIFIPLALRDINCDYTDIYASKLEYCVAYQNWLRDYLVENKVNCSYVDISRNILRAIRKLYEKPYIEQFEKCMKVEEKWNKKVKLANSIDLSWSYFNEVIYDCAKSVVFRQGLLGKTCTATDFKTRNFSNSWFSGLTSYLVIAALLTYAMGTHSPFIGCSDAKQSRIWNETCPIIHKFGGSKRNKSPLDCYLSNKIFDMITVYIEEFYYPTKELNLENLEDRKAVASAVVRRHYDDNQKEIATSNLL